MFLSGEGIAQSSDYSFLDTEQGLSNNWVSQITQDSLGYIWVGTQYGLNKYDGYGFESFTHNPNDSTSLIKNWVKSMAHASDNSFWLGIDYGGVDQFDLTEQKVKHFEFRTVDNKTVTTINKIHRTQNGTVYIGSPQGLFRKPADKHAFSQINELKILDIAEDSKGSLFFLTSSGVHKLVHGSDQSHEIVATDKSNQFISLIADHKDVVWALRKKDLLQLSHLHGTWNINPIPLENPPVSFLFAQPPLFEDHMHRIWIGGENGVSILHGDRKTVETIPYSIMVPSHISHCAALTFFEDKYHNMWIGTNQGLVFKSSFKQRFSKFAVPENSLNDKTVREFIEIEGKLWVASANGLYTINLDLPHASPQKVLDSQ
ncbi:MAG: two-component regulator propeller domain-containing protein, partial [Flavobacteriaceae bacterium]